MKDLSRFDGRPTQRIGMRVPRMIQEPAAHEENRYEG